MNCLICRQKCDQTENQYYSYSHTRIECSNLNCQAVKKTGFHFLIDYKRHRSEKLGEKTIEYKMVYDIISLNFLFEHQNSWYLFSQHNRIENNTSCGVYSLYYFSEERRRGQQWGTFDCINEINQDQLPIDPNNLEHDIMQYFHRVMRLKAFL